MNNIIYIEKELNRSPKIKKFLSRYKNSSIIEIESYGEVFNRKKQSFRLQKNNPCLILAKKHGRKVIPTPKLYSIGRENNYYFSHILNCPFDCKYCFLQGMYRSADYVYFINNEDFFEEIDEVTKRHDNNSITFFSGYDGDSLALDSITNFCSEYIPFFQERSTIDLEIRTKSVNIKPLNSISPTKNIIFAYTLSPEIVAKNIEHKAPSLQARIKAIQSLQEKGWTIGLRFDPIIDFENAESCYKEFFHAVKDQIDFSAIHSVTIGPFRLPKGLNKIMKKDNPYEPLFSSRQRPSLIKYCYDTLLTLFPKRKLFLCVEPSYILDHPLALV